MTSPDPEVREGEMPKVVKNLVHLLTYQPDKDFRCSRADATELLAYLNHLANPHPPIQPQHGKGGHESDGGVEGHAVNDARSPETASAQASGAIAHAHLGKVNSGAGIKPGPSDTPQAQSLGEAYLPFDMPLWQQHEHYIKRLMEQIGHPNSLSLAEAMKQLIRDVEYIRSGRHQGNKTATVVLPSGYKSDVEFASDCGFELAPDDRSSREALLAVRAAITEAPIDVLTDTLWIPERISRNETAVDCIDSALTPRHAVAGDVREAFEEWARSDSRAIQPQEYEERTADNGQYYTSDCDNNAYIGWRECAALSVSTVTGTREDVARAVAEQLGQDFDKLLDFHFVGDRFCKDDFYRVADALSLLNGTGLVQQRACIDGPSVAESDETKSDAERLHGIYDGNGRRRDRGGFCA